MNIFLFHRDLRINDNLGLYKLLEHLANKEVYLFFIFNANQGTQNNEYFGQNSFNYLLQALANLSVQVHINFFEADNEISVFEEVIKTNKIAKIYTNKDFSNFAIARDQQLKLFCQKYDIELKFANDYLLFKPSTIKPLTGEFYKVYTPFWNNCKDKLKTVSKPLELHSFKSLSHTNEYSVTLDKFMINKIYSSAPFTIKEIKKIIFNISNDYTQQRNLLFVESNKISAAIKFGIVSIRQVLLWAFQRYNTFENDFVKQLIWREFFYHFSFLAQKYGYWNFGDNWNRKFNGFEYENNLEKFQAWKNGQTGIPIIDAAMHQLNTTGFMHNRARMIVASFLIKNLLIDWRWGEKYFSQKLVDYDPIVNQMSWQWVAGCGVDAQPFVRIFSPQLQAKRFDKNNIYINKYLPKNYSVNQIVDVKKTAQIAKTIFYKLK